MEYPLIYTDRFDRYFSSDLELPYIILELLTHHLSGLHYRLELTQCE